MLPHNSEPVTFNRACQAVQVPSGERMLLPAESFGYITQALGGSFTVFVDGNLYRIDGKDGEAFGKEALPPPTLPDNASFDDFRDVVWDQLRTVFDPEIPINVVDLGLVYECDIVEKKNHQRDVTIQMTLTAPGCGMGPFLLDDAKNKIEMIPTVDDVTVELVFDPPWDRSMMSDEARLATGMAW